MPRVNSDKVRAYPSELLAVVWKWRANGYVVCINYEQIRILESRHLEALFVQFRFQRYTAAPECLTQLILHRKFGRKTSDTGI